MKRGDPGWSRSEHERTFLRELKHILLDPQNQANRIENENPKIEVEEVRIKASKNERRVEILFRDLDRPECLFGYDWGPTEWLEDDPYISTSIVWANWEEEIYAGRYGLPKECSSRSINWI